MPGTTTYTCTMSRLSTSCMSDLIYIQTYLPLHPYRNDVVGMVLSPSSQPSDLTDMLTWRLTSGTHGVLRPTLGHALVVMVQDVSAVASAHPRPTTHPCPDGTPQGSGSHSLLLHDQGPLGAQCCPPCSEWLRQLLDTGTLVASHNGSFQRCVLCASCDEFSNKGKQSTAEYHASLHRRLRSYGFAACHDGRL